MEGLYFSRCGIASISSMVKFFCILPVISFSLRHTNSKINSPAASPLMATTAAKVFFKGSKLRRFCTAFGVVSRAVVCSLFLGYTRALNLGVYVTSPTTTSEGPLYFRWCVCPCTSFNPTLLEDVPRTLRRFGYLLDLSRV